MNFTNISNETLHLLKISPNNINIPETQCYDLIKSIEFSFTAKYSGFIITALISSLFLYLLIKNKQACITKFGEKYFNKIILLNIEIIFVSLILYFVMILWVE